MRLLLALDTWGLVGGSERYAGTVAGALSARGHDVTVLCARDDSPPFALTGRVLHLPSFIARAPSRVELKLLRETVSAARPDAIFLLTCRSAATFAELLELAPLARFVQDHSIFCPALNKFREDGQVCVEPQGLACLQRYFLASGCTGYHPAAHGGRVHKGVTTLLRKLSEFELARRAARLIVASHYMRNELVRAGAAPEQCVRIPYFTRSNTPAQPREALPEATERWLDASSAPLLFTPARMALPDKGVDFLITALAKVRAPFRAVIAGDGPARAWLERKALDEGLAERVHFAGWLGQGAIEELHARARAMVCPSVWNEPFGLVGLEAMAHERPAIAFDVGGIPEWLAHEETGLLVPRGDTDSLAAAMERVLADEPFARALGLAGRARLEREFGEERHVESLERELGAVSRS